MKRSSSLFLAGAVFVFGVAGCQAIGGIQPRATDPLVTGCTLPGVASAQSTGNGRIRLVNLGTSAATGNADFCVRPSGAASWGRPVFRDGGNDSLCMVGLAYQQSTVPFSVPVGKIDVKAIPAGQTCAAAATSEIDGVAIGDAIAAPPGGGNPAPPVTILRWGNAAAEHISALPEEPGNPTTTSSSFRIVNALATGKPINVGNAADSYVPTTLSALAYSQAIPPGGVEPAGSNPLGAVDALGYLTIVAAPFKIGIASADDHANRAIVVFNTRSTADVATMYVAGDPGDNAHTVQGLYCEDRVNLATAVASGAVDAGAPSSDAGGALTAQDQALLAQCTPTKPPLISVDTVNVGLYGANAPFADDRRPAIYAAIAARTSDVMCIVEVDNLTDRTNIASNAAARFPYSYMVATGQDTAPTRASDAPPSAPTVPPCDPSVVPAATVENIYNCVNQNCSTSPSDPTFSGTLNQSTNCLANNCTQQFIPIYHRDQALNGCFDCIVLYLTSEQKLSAGQTACTTDTHQPYAFLGQTPTMILSHYPLSNQHVYVLPSTGFRRAVLQATVTLENDQKFDFFCGQLTTPLIDQSLPYVGYFGKDDPLKNPPENGWQDEQDRQTQEVIDFIAQQSKADGLPAIVTGDWQSTDGAAADAGAGALGSQSPEVIQAMQDPRSGLVEATPPDYVPACDYCPAPQNPYNTSTAPLSFLRTFLSGFPTGSTQSHTTWGTENDVTIKGSADAPPPPGGVGPIADTYPSNVTVLRPAAR